MGSYDINRLAADLNICTRDVVQPEKICTRFAT